MLWLLEERHASAPEELADALEHRSGLLGLSGSADMPRSCARAAGRRRRPRASPWRSTCTAARRHRRDGRRARRHRRARLHRRRRRAITAEVRARAAEGLAFLGLHIDPEANRDGEGDRLISPAGAGADVLTLAAREDLEVARQVRTVLSH